MTDVMVNKEEERARLPSPLKLLARTEMAIAAAEFLDAFSESAVPACCREAGHREPLMKRVADWAPVQATDCLTAAAVMIQSVASVPLLTHTPCTFDCPQTLWLVDDLLTEVARRDRRNAYWVRAFGQSTIKVRRTDGHVEFISVVGTAPLHRGDPT